MSKSKVISLPEALQKVEFVGNRTPESTDEQLAGAFAELAPYRDGAIYVGHYAGNSEWERHPQGDEIVYVLDGEVHLFLLTEGGEQEHRMRSGELLVVPMNTWHRFEVPTGVRVFTATPQPTDHSVSHPHD